MLKQFYDGNQLIGQDQPGAVHRILINPEEFTALIAGDYMCHTRSQVGIHDVKSETVIKALGQV